MTVTKKYQTTDERDHRMRLNFYAPEMFQKLKSLEQYFLGVSPFHDMARDIRDLLNKINQSNIDEPLDIDRDFHFK